MASQGRSIGDAVECAGLFKRRNHLIYRYHGGIIIHRIDFTEFVPSAGYFANTGQPVQGCFAHIISGHIEDDSG